MASPTGCQRGSGLVLLGSDCWHSGALSNFHSASEQIGIKSRLPVGVNSPIVVELKVDKLEM